MRPLLNGTLFSLPLPDGTYLPGRVLLDVKGCARKKLFPERSALSFFFGCRLVEMYSLPTKQPEFIHSSVLIQGALIIADAIGKKWPIIGTIDVDPKKVEFPESLGSYNHPGGDGSFYCGEIGIFLPLPKKILEERHCFGAIGLGDSWSYACYNLLNSKNQSQLTHPWIRYGESDLRYSPLRSEIYRHLPFPMDMPYYDKQKLMGLDFDRLYDSSPAALKKKS